MLSDPAGSDGRAPMPRPVPALAPPFPSRRLLFLIAATIVVADQVSKGMVRAWLPLHSSVTVIPDLLDFRYVRNTGAAFGLLNNVDIPFKPALMTAIALFAMIAIAAYASRTAADERLARLGLALVLGGAMGNLIDRIATGYVVDFVDVYWRGWHFWAFNVADAAITVGAGCVILDTIRSPQGVERETRDPLANGSRQE